MATHRSGEKMVGSSLSEVTTESQYSDPKKNSSLIKASMDGNLVDVKRILAAGRVNVNCKDALKWTPVMLGARRGHREVVEFLISKGADVSLVDVHGNNFLHWACCGGDVEMVKFILSQKMADINSRGVSNMTPVMWAAYRGHSEVVEFLMRAGADVSLVDVNGNNILHWACEGGDAQIVKFVLSLDKMDIDARNEKGQTAADYYARLWGHHKVVDVLVSRCAQ